MGEMDVTVSCEATFRRYGQLTDLLGDQLLQIGSLTIALGYVPVGQTELYLLS